MSSIRIGAGGCAIEGIRTSLNLRHCRVYHPWMDVKGQAEKLRKINADEY
jgi:hypothetical protein